MERFQDGFSGFHPLIGGMRTGSGFALGATVHEGESEHFRPGFIQGLSKV